MGQVAVRIRWRLSRHVRTAIFMNRASQLSKVLHALSVFLALDS